MKASNKYPKWEITIKEIRALLISLKQDIGEEYRANEEDENPGMCVTISTNDGTSWDYQTGDNSYSGGCYGQRHWSVISLYPRSNSTELAREVVSELRDLVETERENSKEDPAGVIDARVKAETSMTKPISTQAS